METFTIIGLASIVTGIASITLAIVSIWLAKSSVRESQTNFEKTSKALSEISERATGIEAIVGPYFDKIMDTMINIVNTATSGPEIRKAELEAQESQRAAKLQEEMFKLFTDAAHEPEKLDHLVNLMAKMAGLSSQWGGKGETPPAIDSATTICNVLNICA